MFSFGALSDLVENGRALKMNEALFFVFSKNDHIQDLIIELNTEGQLFAKGIDSTGKLLSDIGGDYSPITVEIKRFQGLPFDHVTLFDEGDFYRSFAVDVSKDYIEIEANTIKKGDDLQDRWGDDILGLSDESLEILIDEIIPEIIDYLERQLLR